MNVLEEVAAERRRQVEVEGWTPGHDDEHARGELAIAAICYADPDPYRCPVPKGGRECDHKPRRWPWSRDWWKPKGRRRDLIRAIALLVAEVERLDRAAHKETAS